MHIYANRRYIIIMHDVYVCSLFIVHCSLFIDSLLAVKEYDGVVFINLCMMDGWMDVWMDGCMISTMK